MAELTLTDEEVAALFGAGGRGPALPFLAGLPAEHKALAVACGVRSLVARGLLSSIGDQPVSTTRAGAAAAPGATVELMSHLHGALAQVVGHLHAASSTLSVTTTTAGPVVATTLLHRGGGAVLAEQITPGGLHHFALDGPESTAERVTAGLDPYAPRAGPTLDTAVESYDAREAVAKGTAPPDLVERLGATAGAATEIVDLDAPGDPATLLTVIATVDGLLVAVPPTPGSTAVVLRPYSRQGLIELVLQILAGAPRASG